jgi:hypothetical protein
MRKTSHKYKALKLLYESTQGKEGDMMTTKQLITILMDAAIGYMYSKNIIYELERRGVLRRMSWGVYTVDIEKLGEMLAEVE